MSRRVAAVALAAALGACSVGPAYRPAPVVPAGSRVGTPRLPDSTRAFFDSLAAARASDTARPAPAPLPPRRLVADSVADLAWVDVLKDTVLTRLVGVALANNRDVASARARVEEYRAFAGVAYSALWPSLTANGSVSRNQIVFATQPTPILYTAWRATADLSWELSFWGVKSGIDAANSDLAAQRAAERAAVLSLVSNVATGYLQLLELDQEHAVAERTLSSRQATLDLARQRFGRGLISELDVRQFEAQVAVPAARLAQVEQLRSQQEHALNVLLGEGPMPIRRGISLAAAVRAVVVPDSIPSTLIARRPDVQAAERAYAAATARVGIADAARLPVFTITGSYGGQSPTASKVFGSQSRIYTVLGGISIPLFAGGRLVNEGRVARAQAEQARAQYEQAVLVALGEAGDALVGVRAARDAAAALQTQATALRRALALAEMRYRSGVSNYLEVLDAERSLFDAELAASQAQLQQLTAAVQLYKALGGSWVVPAR